MLISTPCETQPGNATVVVRVNGSTATVTVPVTQYQPGIFDTTFNGQRYAVLVRQNGSYVTLDNPAHLGEHTRRPRWLAGDPLRALAEREGLVDGGETLLRCLLAGERPDVVGAVVGHPSHEGEPWPARVSLR